MNRKLNYHTVWERDRENVDHYGNEKHQIYEAGRHCRKKALELILTLHIMNLFSHHRLSAERTDRQQLAPVLFVWFFTDSVKRLNNHDDVQRADRIHLYI